MHLRLEILLDSAHTEALIHHLRSLGFEQFVVERGIRAHGFETAMRRIGYNDVLGTSRLFVYCDQSQFDEAKPSLIEFLDKCGGAAFSSHIEVLRH